MSPLVREMSPFGRPMSPLQTIVFSESIFKNDETIKNHCFFALPTSQPSNALRA